jgi:hypothetical protein
MAKAKKPEGKAQRTVRKMWDRTSSEVDVEPKHTSDLTTEQAQAAIQRGKKRDQ